MGFRRSDLQEAFFVPGTHPFRVWGYGTTDPLGELLRPDYFRAAGGLMQAGDLIYVSVRPQGERGVSTRPRCERPGAPKTGKVRMALVMVRVAERGAPSVRLVQDFGGPDDPDAATLAVAPAAAAVTTPAPDAQPRRGRGRPPGSRARKPAPAPAVDTSASASARKRGKIRKFPAVRDATAVNWRPDLLRPQGGSRPLNRKFTICR